MNEFYSIGQENKKPSNPYQLNNLGKKIASMSFGIATMGGSYKDDTIYRNTTSKDYDSSFSRKLTSINPPYDINKLLNFHLNYYVNEYKGDKEKFIKQIKYIVLPLVKKQKDKEVYVTLINEWLEEDNISKVKTPKNYLTNEFQSRFKKKYQIFISSTYTDLKKERVAAVEAILKADHIPAGMELFKAGKETLETIKKWIDESDLYILILGGRYGTIHEESGRSYTEIEYRYALENNKYPFAIIIADTAIRKKIEELGEADAIELHNKDKYERFKIFVKKNICEFSEDEKDVKLHIANNITNIINEYGHLLNGWISGRDINNFSPPKYITTNNDFPVAYPPEPETHKEKAAKIKKKKEFEEYKQSYFFPDGQAVEDSKLFVEQLFLLLTDEVAVLEDNNYKVLHFPSSPNIINVRYGGLVLIFEWIIKSRNSLTNSLLRMTIKKEAQMEAIIVPIETYTTVKTFECEFDINQEHQNVWVDKKNRSNIFTNTELVDMWLKQFMNEIEKT